MNSVMKQLILKGHCMPRSLTYTFLTSWRKMTCFQSRQLSTASCQLKSRYVAKIAKNVSQGTTCIVENESFCCTARIVRYSIQSIAKRRLYSSSIFISDREQNTGSSFSFDHNLEEKLSNLDELKTNLYRRGLNMDVDLLKKDYQEYVELEKERLRIESKREDIARQIAGIVEQQKESKIKSKELASKMKSLAEEGKKAKILFKELMVQYWDVEERVMLAALSLPNHLSHDVPDETKVLEEYFQERKPALPVDHFEVLKDSQMVRLSNVGHKAYYLKGRLPMLQQELVTHFSQQLRSNNITQMSAPEMFKSPVVEGSSLDVTDPASVYKLQHKQGTRQMPDWDPDNMFLHGASQLSFLSYFARMSVSPTDLPVRMFVVGSHYQPEDSETEKLPGLLGVLQTIQVCMCGVCNTRESSVAITEQFMSILSDIYKQFELPFRLVSIPASSLTAAEQNRTELQMWVPSLQTYLKLASVSVCGEYSSRRLMIRCADGTRSTKPVEMVYCEVTDITKLLAVLLEYGQTDRQWGR